MDRETFVDAVRRVVRDAAVADTLVVLSRPPGRRPEESLVSLSAWFDELAPPDRERLEQVIEMAANFSTFAFLSILDGARAIDDEGGTLDLPYRNGIENVSLNGEAGSTLHELL